MSAERTEARPRSGPRSLLHEPPILDYDKFEGYDRAQKWFKDTATSQADLTWKSGYLNFYAEGQLLDDYHERAWENYKRPLDDNKLKQPEFYLRLACALRADEIELKHEKHSFCRAHGKMYEDLLGALEMEIKEVSSKKGPPPGYTGVTLKSFKDKSSREIQEFREQMRNGENVLSSQF